VLVGLIDKSHEFSLSGQFTRGLITEAGV
jgi:hypothetical protein